MPIFFSSSGNFNTYNGFGNTLYVKYLCLFFPRQRSMRICSPLPKYQRSFNVLPDTLSKHETRFFVFAVKKQLKFIVSVCVCVCVCVMSTV